MDFQSHGNSRRPERSIPRRNRIQRHDNIIAAIFKIDISYARIYDDVTNLNRDSLSTTAMTHRLACSMSTVIRWIVTELNTRKSEKPRREYVFKTEPDSIGITYETSLRVLHDSNYTPTPKPITIHISAFSALTVGVRKMKNSN